MERLTPPHAPNAQLTLLEKSLEYNYRVGGPSTGPRTQLRLALRWCIDMNDKTTKEKIPIKVGSITINADNPDDIILAILRYHKSVRLHR